MRDAFSRTPMSPALLAAMARSLECGSSVVSIQQQQQEQQPCSGRKSAVAFFEGFENFGKAILRRLALLNMSITLNFFIWSLLISLGNHSALLLCHGLSLHSAYAHGEVGIFKSKPSYEKYSTIDLYIHMYHFPAHTSGDHQITPRQWKPQLPSCFVRGHLRSVGNFSMT